MTESAGVSGEVINAALMGICAWPSPPLSAGHPRSRRQHRPRSSKPRRCPASNCSTPTTACASRMISTSTSTASGSRPRRSRPTRAATTRGTSWATTRESSCTASSMACSEPPTRRTPTSRRSPISMPASWTRPRSSSCGLKPLDAEFARIDALHSKQQIAALIAHFNRIGVPAPYSPYVHQDAKDSPSTCSIWARMAWGCPTATTTCWMTGSSSRRASSTGARRRRCCRWPATARPATHAREILALETALAQVAVDQGREPRSGQDLQQGRCSPSCRAWLPAIDWNAYLRDARRRGHDRLPGDRSSPAT